jgi:uncharacterized peroxidase-related enzyme
MAWINTISYEAATGRLKRLYDKIKGPDNNVDNIMMAHSLRPHTMKGHMEIYKSVLHHTRNTFPKWLLEALGVYVSHLNKCNYCFEHHYAGMKRLINEDEKSEKIRAAFLKNQPELAFAGRELALMTYARRLTLNPTVATITWVKDLKTAGLDDGEILEANQVISYFAYANRMVVGLGINTEGDIIGLSPGDMDDEGNWQHY